MQKLIRVILALFSVFSVLVASGPGLALRRLKNLDVSPVEYPRAAVTANRLLLTDYPVGDDALTVASLQGVLANASGTQILIRDGAYEKYLPYTNAETVETRPDGSRWDAASLLRDYGSFARGYVLCDGAGAGAAVTVAGVLQAVIVAGDMERTAIEAGLKKLEDVRGWTDARLRLSPYFREVNKKIAVEQPVSLAPKLVDLAVMAGAYFGYSDASDVKKHERTFGFLKDNAVIFGWNPALGEYDTVASLSEMNICLIPADHGSNYSTLSGFGAAAPRQKTVAPSGAPARARTVCLVMTDGDNLQWMTTQFTDAAHYGSPLRGAVPLGWGVPASLPSVAAPMAAYLYDGMTENDEFITQISGLGYTFPSAWTNKTAFEVMANQLAEQMAKADTRIAAVLDDGGFGSGALDTLLGQPGIDALFYFDYADYAGCGGAVRTVNGKPIVSARYKLWAGIDGGSPEEIAAAVNASSDDPSSLDSYALIAVHAWSGLDGNGAFAPYGDTMAAVKRLADAFGPDVRIVTPGAFAALVARAAA